MGAGRYQLTRDDLKAMRKEFGIGVRFDEHSRSFDEHLHQVRRNVRMGVRLKDWAKTRGVPLTYARALRRFIEQG